MISFREISGWLVAGLISISVYLYSTITPTPYRDVHHVSVTQVDDILNYTANFVKTECKFLRLQVVGTVLGQSTVLKWDNLEEGIASKEVDRAPGAHTLRIAIDTDNVIYDKIEIRVRHDCDGEIVDTTFDTILPEEITSAG